MGKRGRPPVLDDGKRREILAILSTGCSQAMAAEYVGCSVSTIQRTVERDPLFAESLGKARNNAELGLVRNIRNAANNEKYWRAAAWALERFFPNKYHTGGGPHVISAEQLAQVLTQFAHMIVEQVPVERYRKNIIKGLEAMVRNLGQTIAEEAARKNLAAQQEIVADGPK